MKIFFFNHTKEKDLEKGTRKGEEIKDSTLRTEDEK